MTSRKANACSINDFDSPTVPTVEGGQKTGKEATVEQREQSDDNFLTTLFKRLDEVRTDEPRLPRLIRSRLKLRGRRKIGSGGLGVVYEFKDFRLNRMVALKVAKSRAMASPAKLERFLRERKITAKLQHPAIPPVYYSGTVKDGRPYYVMRLIKGKTLHAEIKTQELRSSDQLRSNSHYRRIIECFIDVCGAVQYAHNKNVLHRDIKPANIMLEEGGASFLVDWGLAREVDQADPTVEPMQGSAEMAKTLTQDGQQLGSPDWMSPEQASGLNRLHGKATDI